MRTGSDFLWMLLLMRSKWKGTIISIVLWRPDSLNKFGLRGFRDKSKIEILIVYFYMKQMNRHQW
jgi:hypothetical protein